MSARVTPASTVSTADAALARRHRIRELMKSKAVRDAVDQAPPFTPDQRARLAALLNSTH